jgi:hypothetical protein
MPQPFKRRLGQQVKTSPAAVMERPQIAIGIALVASHWSKLEQTLSLPFTVLLSGQEPSAFEAYHELFELSLRHKMFLAAAKRKKLPSELIEEATRIHEDARRIAKSRNAVVHGTWSTIEGKLESAFLSEPDAIDRKVDDLLRDFHDKVDSHESGQAALPWSFDLSLDEFVEYKASDLQDIINRCIALDNRVTHFWQKVAAFALSTERSRRAQRSGR